MTEWWNPAGNLASVNPWGVAMVALGAALAVAAQPLSRLWPARRCEIAALAARILGLALTVAGFLAAVLR